MDPEFSFEGNCSKRHLHQHLLRNVDGLEGAIFKEEWTTIVSIAEINLGYFSIKSLCKCLFYSSQISLG
jgi:hypothetical protein